MRQTKQPHRRRRPAYPQSEPSIAVVAGERDIRNFLAGRTDGAALLHALYDHILAEPVPDRLRALLRR
jgi:Anti-sigma factor NepR